MDMGLSATAICEPARDFIRRETIVSTSINTALSLVFFLVVFRLEARIPVWGMGHLAFDTLPQAFMITLMGTLVPGMVAKAKLKKGKVAALPGRSGLPHSPISRAIVMAVVATVVCALAGYAIFVGLGADSIAWLPALVGKLVFGALLALIVTPIGLSAGLSAR